MIRLVRFNLAMTIIWVALLIPTLTWWRDSVMWIVVVCLYANAAAHWSAYQVSRATVNPAPVPTIVEDPPVTVDAPI